MKPLGKYPYICFDFDGVIKDSVSIKGEIFVHLFRSFPKLFVTRYLHHLKMVGLIEGPRLHNIYNGHIRIYPILNFLLMPF